MSKPDKHTTVVRFPCADHPTGELLLMVTGQTWIDMDGRHHDAPLKRCARCEHAFPAPLFLKRGRLRSDGYLLIEDSPLCRDCEPEENIPLNLNEGGKACYRITMRDERGEPYRTFDIKARVWGALRERGIRRMVPDGNEFRLQPYKDRRPSGPS